jgi:hypothetical protein
MSPVDAIPLLAEELLRAAAGSGQAAYWIGVFFTAILVLLYAKLRKIQKDFSARNAENRHNAVAQNSIDNANAEAQQHSAETEIEALIRRREDDAGSGKRGQ